MNTTQKQILELIEPYMAKEYKRENLIIEKYIFLNKYEILWPKQCTYFYDITAVLKYIVKHTKNYHITDKFIQYWYDWVDDYWHKYEYQWWEIPNKPLHLYSEQEEKDLLELLTKIWQTNK